MYFVNGSTNLDGSRGSRDTTCDPMIHDLLTDDTVSQSIFKSNFNNLSFGDPELPHQQISVICLSNEKSPPQGLTA